MANHERLYTRQQVAAELGKPKLVEFSKVEATMLGHQERAIYANLEMDDMFCKSGMVNKLMLNINMVADSKKHNRQLFNGSVVQTSFESDVEWYLDPMEANAYSSDREVGNVISDTIIQGQMNASFRHLTGSEACGLFTTGAIAKMNLKQDMRHMFAKMYLMLSDYNLAMSSRMDETSVASTLNLSVYNEVSSIKKLEIMSMYNVVVDAEMFTPAELGLLKVAGCEYPSVRYGGLNVYTQCHMQQDTVAIMSEGKVAMDTSLSWGSPSRLYDLICSVACKMGCLDDMVEAFTSMRGMCFLMQDVFRHAEDNSVVSDMPLSKSYKCATGVRNRDAVTMSERGGLFATTKSLVSEMLLGKLGEVVASNFLEEIGAYGDLFGSSTPSTSSRLNGFMRDYGLNHANSKVNSLLYQWQVMLGKQIHWGLGLAVKNYALSLAGKLHNGTDISVPQLEYILYMNEYKNTCWGMVRNWSSAGNSFDSKAQRVKAIEESAAFTWVMGVRDRRPVLFGNKKNDREVFLSAQERSFLCGHGGLDFTINSMGICIAESVSTRIDELEITASALIKSNYIKAGSMIMYDRGSGWGFPEATDRNDDDDARLLRSFGGALTERPRMPPSVFGGEEEEADEPEEEGEPDIPLHAMSSGGSRDTNTRLNTYENLPVVSLDQRYIRTDDEDRKNVAPYKINGVERREAGRLFNRQTEDGHTFNYDLIERETGGRGAMPAIMKDLSVRGMCAQADYMRVCQDVEKEAEKSILIDEKEIAKAVNSMKLDVQIFEETDDGVRVYKTDNGHKHIVSLWRDEDEFRALVLSPGAKIRVTEVVEAPKQKKSDSIWPSWM